MLYKIIDPDRYSSVTSQLDDRQAALLVGALNYHSLVNPIETLDYQVYLSTDGHFPRLTDTSTVQAAEDGQPTWADQAKLLGSFRAVGTNAATPATPPSYDLNAHPITDTGMRFICLSSTAANDAVAKELEKKQLKQRIYDLLERRSTLVLDGIREAKIQLNLLRNARPFFRADDADYEARPDIAQVVPLSDYKEPICAIDRPKAVLLGLHWLQTGGAERWAVEAVALAKEAGLIPIVLTDQLSHHYWITRPQLQDCLIIPMTMPVQSWVADEPLLRALTECFDITDIFLHHNSWLYLRLPWFKFFSPQTRISDSTHIVEYSKGGYPGVSVKFDDFIDVHHVISPQLRDWMVKTQKVAPNKVVLAPLVGLTTPEIEAAEPKFRPRQAGKPFTVAAIGRLARQKRPDIFLLAISRLHQAFPQMRFIWHGDGELQPLVERQIDQLNLQDVLIRRGEDTPVSTTLDEADLLLLTSTNEGLALTVLEAVFAGVPVISTDVGSQETLVPPQGLLPRFGMALLRKVVPLVGALSANEDYRRALWEEEAARTEEFAKLPNAVEWMRGYLKND